MQIKADTFEVDNMGALSPLPSAKDADLCRVIAVMAHAHAFSRDEAMDSNIEAAQSGNELFASGLRTT